MQPYTKAFHQQISQKKIAVKKIHFIKSTTAQIKLNRGNNKRYKIKNDFKSEKYTTKKEEEIETET